MLSLKARLEHSSRKILRFVSLIYFQLVCDHNRLINVVIGLNLLFDNFERASTKRVNSKGKDYTDPTIYLGAGGVAYALLRACRLSAADSKEPEKEKEDFDADKVGQEGAAVEEKKKEEEKKEVEIADMPNEIVDRSRESPEDAKSACENIQRGREEVKGDENDDMSALLKRTRESF